VSSARRSDLNVALPFPWPLVSFRHDAVGNRLWITDGQGRADYAYDTFSRLKTETRKFKNLLDGR